MSIDGEVEKERVESMIAENIMDYLTDKATFLGCKARRIDDENRYILEIELPRYRELEISDVN